MLHNDGDYGWNIEDSWETLGPLLVIITTRFISPAGIFSYQVSQE